MLALFLAALDQTIVGHGLPRIVTDLRGTQTLHLGGHRLPAHQHGHRTDLRQAVRPVRAAADADDRHRPLPGRLRAVRPVAGRCGSSILFRGIQGLGAGALFPICLAVIGDLFSPRERGRYQGLFGAVFGIAVLVGPFLGGFLTDNFSWHWVFFVNLPVGRSRWRSSGGCCRPSSQPGGSLDRLAGRASSPPAWCRSSSA